MLMPTGLSKKEKAQYIKDNSYNVRASKPGGTNKPPGLRQPKPAKKVIVADKVVASDSASSR